jgi:hypothetical protein
MKKTNPENDARPTKRHCSQVGFKLFQFGASEATQYLNRQSKRAIAETTAKQSNQISLPLQVDASGAEPARVAPPKLQSLATQMEIKIRSLITEMQDLSFSTRCSEATLSRLRKSAVEDMSPGVEPQACSRAAFLHSISSLPDDIRSAVVHIYEDVRIPARYMVLYAAHILVLLASEITLYAGHKSKPASRRQRVKASRI